MASESMHTQVAEYKNISYLLHFQRSCFVSMMSDNRKKTEDPK